MDTMDGVPQFRNFHFHTVDYCVFAAMLLLSATSGAYFGYIRRRNERQNKTRDVLETVTTTKKGGDFGSASMNEYLLGSRKLKAFPVAMSLVASYISGVTMLGTPAEIYNFGTQYWLIVFPIFLMGLVVSYVYLPVFTTLKVGSSYEYLEFRFSSTVRTIASVMFVIDEILFLPIVIYVPALAFNQVTGANIFTIGSVVCAVCIFYTIVGGIKAVVHTDAWQVIVMFISVVVCTGLGTHFMGGFQTVFERANEGGRIVFFNTNPSMYERHTLWSVVIGGFTYWTSFNAVNQTMVQRYMSLPSLKKARQSILIFTIGVIMFVSVCCYAGVLVYAEYWKCDPKSEGYVQSDDQLFPAYVMQTVGNFRGIPGLFVAGVFGAALSSLSVVLNSTAGVLLEDIFKGCFKGRPSEAAASIIVKSSILILGCMAMVLLLVVDKLGGILELATSLSAIAAGTTFGIFTLGMLNPYSNNKGAIYGAIAGALMSGWISFGTQIAVANGTVMAHRLGVSTDECPSNNYTTPLGLSTPIYQDESDIFPLYRLSFHWINPIGIMTVLIVGSIVSYITGPRDLSRIDVELISPVIHRFLPKDCMDNYNRLKLNVTSDVEPETLTLKLPNGDFQNDHNHTTVRITANHYSI